MPQSCGFSSSHQIGGQGGLTDLLLYKHSWPFSPCLFNIGVMCLASHERVGCVWFWIMTPYGQAVVRALTGCLKRIGLVDAHMEVCSITGMLQMFLRRVVTLASGRLETRVMCVL